MKRTILLLIAIVAFVGATNGHAGASFGVNVDWNKFEHSSRHDWGLGARLAFGGAGLDFTTGFDYYFVAAGSFIENTDNDNGLDLKFWELFENATYTFPTGSVRPYVGAGVDYARRNFNN